MPSRILRMSAAFFRLPTRCAVLLVLGLLVLGLLPGCSAPCGDALICRWVEASEERPLTIVAYGTSLTASGGWPYALSLDLERFFPGRSRIEITAESARASDWGLAQFEARVLAHAPDVLFVEFAVNDAFVPYDISVATSRANLETMLDRLDTDYPSCAVVLIVTNHVVGEGAAIRPNLADYYAEVRRIAGERGLLLVDEEAAWRRLRERAPAVFDVLVPDGLHPTYAGNDRVTRPLLWDALHDVETDLDALVAAVIAATPVP
jgi:lysophospholipase L1-like esterase